MSEPGLDQGDDGLPLGPEDKRRATAEQPRVFIDGHEAVGFMAGINTMQRDTRQILTTLRTVVAPQLADLKLAVRAGDERMERHATVAHNRIDGVERRVGDVEAAHARRPPLILLILAAIAVVAIGGALAMTAGTFLVHVWS